MIISLDRVTSRHIERLNYFLNGNISKEELKRLVEEKLREERALYPIH